MKSKNKDISDLTKNIISKLDEYDIKHEKQVIMFRFLSEIERLADERGINRKTLAKLINTSASYLTQLYRGTKPLNIETIAKLQKVLDVKFEIIATPSNWQPSVSKSTYKEIESQLYPNSMSIPSIIQC
ncbi:MAG: helix-turn-helix transcriptional regulator [Bacteroidota bacterium]|nr:helix-turn-helix transcriptional regulator [Bacteroidota bacterium]